MKRLRLVNAWLATCALLLLAACGSDSEQPQPTTDPATRQILEQQEVLTGAADTTFALVLRSGDEPWQATVDNGETAEGESPWCTATVANAGETSTVQIHVTRNPEMGWRRAQLTLTQGERRYVVTLRQHFAPQLRLRSTHIDVATDSTNAYVFVTANQEHTVTVPAEASWLKVESRMVEKWGGPTRPYATFIYRLRCEPNRGLGRAAELTIAAPGAVPVSVTVHQGPRTLREQEEMRVDKPGELGTLLGSDPRKWRELRSLKLSGQLNDADMQALRTLLCPEVSWRWTNAEGNVVSTHHGIPLNLQQVDLGECSLVTCGTYAEKAIGTTLDAYVSRRPDVLADGAFSITRTPLQRVVLPRGLTAIGHRAFHLCLELCEVDFPASVRSVGSYAFFNCPKLSQIHIPADSQLETLGDEAFHTGARLDEISYPATLQMGPDQGFKGNFTARRIHVKWLVPPALGRFGVNKTSMLCVPRGTAALYRAAPGWNRASEIVEE